jgi:AcrR family transcriptional regulator
LFAKEQDMQHPSIRDRIIDATMVLAAHREWESFDLADVARQAEVGLGEFRDCFPSKGAVLAGLARRIDQAVLSDEAREMADEPARERLFDVLMRRLDAMSPYKAAIRSIMSAVRRDPLMLLALNQTAANSMRFMLAAAGIYTEGPLGALRIQGGVLLFARVVEVWVDDEDKDMAKTMARLDRELDQAGKIIHRIEGFAGPKSPFHSLCERLKAGRPAPRPRRSRRDDEAA